MATICFYGVSKEHTATFFLVTSGRVDISWTYSMSKKYGIQLISYR